MKKVLALLGLFFIVVSCSKEESTIEILIANNPYEVEFNVDYSLPSYLTRIPFPEQVTKYRKFSNWHPPLEAVVLDYDKDGYLDIVETQSEYGIYTRNKIRFMKGTPTGVLEEDMSNSEIYDGLIHGRKGLVGDYNNDGWPDIFFIGHGYDTWDNTYPNEEYPILLLNKEGKGFEYITLQSVVGFFHTGTSGDIDNDGDLDVLLIDGANGGVNSYVLLNNGDGTFIEQSLGYYEKFTPSLLPYVRGKFSSELIDINKDGYLDLILAGHEFGQWDTPPVIIYNSLNGFTRAVELEFGGIFGIVNDIDFYDLDNDGRLEIIFTKTKSNPFYESFKLSILKDTGEDITETYFKGGSNWGTVSDRWLYWTSIIEKDGKVILRGDDMVTDKVWVLENKIFSRQ